MSPRNLLGVYSNVLQIPVDFSAAAGNLTSTTASTVTFLDAGGNSVRAEQMFLFIYDSAPAVVKRVWMRLNGVANVNCFELGPMNWMIPLPFAATSISLYPDGPNLSFDLIAYANDDLSGSTIT